MYLVVEWCLAGDPQRHLGLVDTNCFASDIVTEAVKKMGVGNCIIIAYVQESDLHFLTPYRPHLQSLDRFLSWRWLLDYTDHAIREEALAAFLTLPLPLISSLYVAWRRAHARLPPGDERGERVFAEVCGRINVVLQI